MTRKLTEQEKRERKLYREEKQMEKDRDSGLSERCYEILRILREAPQHPEIKYNSKYFEELFHTSNVTILRDIKLLKDNDLIEEKQIHGSYVIKKNVGQIYSSKTKENLALVASLTGLMHQFKNTPIYENIVKLIYFLEPKVAKDDTVYSSGRIVVAPQMKYHIDEKTWNTIYDAMQKNYKIIFRYKKFFKDPEKRRIVWPLQMVLENGSVYLFSYSENDNDVRIYDMDYVKDIIVTKEKFDLPKDFDINTYTGGGRLGAYVSNKIEKYKIKFTGYGRLWIKKYKLADDQKIQEVTDDYTIVTFTSSQFDKIVQYILSWGANAEPLAPRRLITRWKKEVSWLYGRIK